MPRNTCSRWRKYYFLSLFAMPLMKAISARTFEICFSLCHSDEQQSQNLSICIAWSPAAQTDPLECSSLWDNIIACSTCKILFTDWTTRTMFNRFRSPCIYPFPVYTYGCTFCPRVTPDKLTEHMYEHRAKHTHHAGVGRNERHLSSPL